MTIEGKVRVLLVEDEADSMDLMKETLLGLEDLSFNFFTASQGTEGLQILRETTVDVVLADILMPGMSGLEMLQQMNAAGFWVPCLFVTSLQRREAGIEAMRLGAFDFIEKPISLSKLDEPFHKAIHVSRAFQQLWQQHQAQSPGVMPPATLELMRLRAMRFQNHAGAW